MAKNFSTYGYRKKNAGISRNMKDRKDSLLMDDRENDWLARQLAEEHRAFKTASEMFGLKIEHASHCDAKILAQFHHERCDAHDIDLANGRTMHAKS